MFDMGSLRATSYELRCGHTITQTPSIRHGESTTVAQPVAGMENDTFLPAAWTIDVFAPPELYMTVTIVPFGFLNASASPPLVATTFAPGSTNCEKWRKTW